MANTLTVTAKTGPAKQATSLAIANVNTIKYDLIRQVVGVTTTDGDGNKVQEFDLTGVTTLTISLSGTVYTLVLS